MKLKDLKTGRFVNSLENRECRICGVIFKKLKIYQTCSRKCGMELRKRLYPPPHLGKKRPSEVGEKIRKARIGMKFSEEHKNKLRLARLGKKRAGDPKNWKHSLKTKEIISLKKRGDKCNFWKGGVTKLNIHIRKSFKYILWRNEVYKRDNFTCVFCKATKKYLNADHIIQFAKIIKDKNIMSYQQALDTAELWDINNGRTLCIDCHKNTDTYLNKGKNI